MAAVGAVNITLGAVVSDFVKGMQQARASVAQFSASMNANLAASYAQADRSNRIFSQGIGRMASDLQSFGKSFSATVTAPILAVGVAAFKTYGEIDGMQRGFKALSGSTALATADFNAFKEIAKLPGLGLEEAEEAGLRMRALGYDTKTSVSYLKEFGNAIALGGKGKAEFDSVLNQVTQMSSKSKVLAEDLKPIVNASPVIAKALTDMFGTVDSETISAKLKATGRGPQEFLALLVKQLSTLERVSGGPKNAIENLGDSAKLAGFRFGAAADTAFGLTGKLTGLGDWIGRTADSFAGLSPATQGTILGLTGVAAAIGPVALGLGTLIKLGPTLAAGFGALTSPIAAIAAGLAAVGAAGYAIYQYSQASTTAIDKNRMLAEVTNSANAAIAEERTRLDSLLAVARDEKETKAARLQAIKDLNVLSPKYLGNLSLETVNTNQATKATEQYVKALTLRAQVTDLQVRAAAAQTKLSKMQNDANPNDFMGFAEAWGLGAIQSLKGASEGALMQSLGQHLSERAVAGLSVASREVEYYTTELKKALSDLNKMGESVTPPAVTTPDFKGIETGTKKVKTFKQGLQAELKRVQDEILKFQSKDIAVPKWFEFYERDLKRQLGQLKKTVLPDVQSLTKDIQVSIGKQWVGVKLAALSIPVKIIPQLPNMSETLADIVRKGADVGRLSGILPFDEIKQGVADLVNSTRGGVAEYARVLGELVSYPVKMQGQILSGWSQLAGSITDSLKSASSAALVGMGELVGGMLTGAASLAELPKMFGGIMGGLAKEIGKSMIAFGTAGIAMKTLTKNPVGAIVAGVALTALGAALEASMSRKTATAFATGGFVHGPVQGLVGEYAGARNNPELISPLSEMKKFLLPTISAAVIAGLSTIQMQPQIQPRLDFLQNMSGRFNPQINHSIADRLATRGSAEPVVIVQNSVTRGEDIYHSFHAVDKRKRRGG